MKNDELPPFDPERDNEAVYDEQISPLMTQIIEICKANNIPMVASFQFAGDAFCTSSVLPDGSSAVLFNARTSLYPPKDSYFTMTISSPKKTEPAS
jgi:hypothetical protein